MKKINFALVGCGRISRKHAGTITEHLSHCANLIAVCDIKVDLAKKDKYSKYPF